MPGQCRQQARELLPRRRQRARLCAAAACRGSSSAGVAVGGVISASCRRCRLAPEPRDQRALRRDRAALRRLERACVAATSRLEAREQRERIGLERERLCGRPAAATGTVGIATAAIAAAAAAPCKLEAARKRRARGWQLPQPNEQLGELQVCCGLGGQTRRDRGAKIDAAGLR